MRRRMNAVLQRRYPISLALLVSLTAMTTLAQAHGGGGPDVVLPPLVTSGVLGFLCYWLVVLWPSTHKKHDAEPGSNTQPPLTRARTAVRAKRVPLLRKIRGGAGFTDNVHTGANDA
jgi:putative Ca2+/H+ antiporter (TMEM165/GDT1 family)